jgi:lysozyme
MPSWRLGADDFNQAVEWLVSSAILPAVSPDKDLIASATRRFQEAHPQLDNDGILGRATLDQLQRVVDLKAKSAKGTATQRTGASCWCCRPGYTATTGYGDWILYGSIAVLVVGGVWLAWRYRDELSIALVIGNTDQEGGS